MILLQLIKYEINNFYCLQIELLLVSGAININFLHWKLKVNSLATQQLTNCLASTYHPRWRVYFSV
jgi:hypothetical protein